MGELWTALIGVAVGTGVPWVAKKQWQAITGHAARAEAREASEIDRLTAALADANGLIDVLRQALDKHLIRESAIAAACEMLITLASLIPRPDPAMMRIRDRAQQLLQDALNRTQKIDQGGLYDA